MAETSDDRSTLQRFKQRRILGMVVALVIMFVVCITWLVLYELIPDGANIWVAIILGFFLGLIVLALALIACTQYGAAMRIECTLQLMQTPKTPPHEGNGHGQPV